jgi:hypothetical protein
MKRNLLLSGLIIILPLIAVSQRYEWVSYSTQASANYVAPVAVDPAGNVYTLIHTDPSGGLIQGNAIPCLTPGEGVIIAKFGAAGNFIWGSIVCPDNGIVFGEKIAVDNAGAVYATFNFPNGGAVHLIDTTVNISAAGVIVKLDSSGHFIRLRNYASNSAPRISCLATDLYIGYGGTVSKLDSALNTVWSINDPTGTLEFGYTGFSRADIFVQTNGELIANAFELFNNAGPVAFGNDTVYFTIGSTDEVAVIKLDTSGQVLWTHALHLLPGGLPEIRGVCLDHHGNAYLGAHNMTAQYIFGNDTLENTIGTGPYCAILKWDSAGTPARGMGLYPFASSPELYDLDVNTQDDLLVSGDASSSSISINGDTVFPGAYNFFLFKFNAGGTFEWWKDVNSGPSPGSLADGIAVRNGNEYILAGSTINNTTQQFGCISYSPVTASNFIAMISEQPEIYPVASFTYTVSNDTTYNFSDASQNATSWHWDFGDGDTSNLQNPSHDFAAAANFMVVLTAYHGACSSTDTLQIIGVGMEEINSARSFLISPNPSAGNFTITFKNMNDKMSLEIFTLLGERIFGEAMYRTSKKEINPGNIPSGIYFVKVLDGDSYYCRKMIVEKN